MTIAFIQKLKNTGSNLIITPQDGSHKAYLTARLFLSTAKTTIVVRKNLKQARRFLEDVSFFLPEHTNQIVFFPGYHILPFKSLSYHRETSTSRLAVLSKFVNPSEKPLLIVTALETLLQKLIPRSAVNDFCELLLVNEETDRDALVLKLESGGYTRTSLVEDPGEYSVRGGILDVYSPGEPYPVRAEFFGDVVESIRYFNVYTQRGIKELKETIIVPATEAVVTEKQLPHILARVRQAGGQAGMEAPRIREVVNTLREFKRFDGIESMLSIIYEHLDSFFEYAPENALWILDDCAEFKKEADDFEQKSLLNYKTAAMENRLCVTPESIYLDWNTFITAVRDRHQTQFVPLDVTGKSREKPLTVYRFDIKDNQGLQQALHQKGGAETDQPLAPLVDWIQEHKDHNRAVCFVVSQESQVKRLISLLQPYGIELTHQKHFSPDTALKGQTHYTIGNISSGFVSDQEGFVLITDDEIFGKKRIRRPKSGRRDLKTEFIAPEELKNGDIVVHIEHGVGRYEGLHSLTVNRITQDFILIVYKDEDKLYLPVDRIEMIGKYIGVDGYVPVLDKIGSKAWAKSKVKAKKEVEKLAADLLDLYAKRKVNNGFAFSRPDNYYNEFETTFPYEETRDQLRAIDEVHLDMESNTPMDRLVCGDVGYGKTEVAIRAAFKAVNDGKQAAVVVPTTILAEQHLVTFKDRFSNYPVNIECLSRFRTKAQQTKIIKAMKSGLVDIVIGTHRLLQKDIDFKSLGLLVIDEEQRFGVKHKEMLKKKRSSVDVLALTATPIPRTLHLSLTGMRDISVIATAPADRQPIVSYISKYDDLTVKDAIQKELSRKGQVFFVHNNIKTIEKVTLNLKNLLPDARFGIAHGRLSETDLENVMHQFVNFEIDVLVCTTIIESGLDIPSANTMIINKAERFGLSQIYQLRGRIGRGDFQAYAYLFISDESRLTKDAKKRLSALMEYKDLGSGFQIAMKDLQIRGAGTALGASQSGHIAAVGYDMFLKLLDQAVHDFKGEAKVESLEPEINAAMSSGFPQDYIESVEQRLTLYRRLSRISDVSDLIEFKKELTDRYGKPPKEAENMLVKIMLRIYAIKAGIKRLDLTPLTLTLVFSLEHNPMPLSAVDNKINSRYPCDLLTKDSIRIRLARKRNAISKALTQTRDILKLIS